MSSIPAVPDDSHRPVAIPEHLKLVKAGPIVEVKTIAIKPATVVVFLGPFGQSGMVFSVSRYDQIEWFVCPILRYGH